jgi:hypothetical protein
MIEMVFGIRHKLGYWEGVKRLHLYTSNNMVKSASVSFDHGILFLIVANIIECHGLAAVVTTDEADTVRTSIGLCALLYLPRVSTCISGTSSIT